MTVNGTWLGYPAKEGMWHKIIFSQLHKHRHANISYKGQDAYNFSNPATLQITNCQVNIDQLTLFYDA